MVISLSQKIRYYKKQGFSKLKWCVLDGNKNKKFVGLISAWSELEARRKAKHLSDSYVIMGEPIRFQESWGKKNVKCVCR